MSAREVVVVDASALVDALTARGSSGDRARDALRGVRWAAPEHMRMEVAQAVRGRWLGGRLAQGAAERAVQRLGAAVVEIAPTPTLLERVWALRDNLSAYDAAYVAAAELLRAPLVTGDRRLAAAPGVDCRYVLV